MSDTTELVARRVDRVRTKTVLGPDAQVDDKALLIMPDAAPLTDPFLALSEDWFSSPGFEWHPHRGLETVTLVVDGVLEHGDNLGNRGALEPGDVQWMTAGRGIIHRELAFRNEHAHTLQLWVNLPASQKLVETRYQDLRAADHGRLRLSGVDVRVVSGSTGEVNGPAVNHWPILGLVLTIDPATTYRPMIPARDRAFAHVLSGRVAIAGRSVEAGQTAWSDPVTGGSHSTWELRTPDSDERATVLLFAGPPIREPVVLGGPFVMNSEAEIRQAFHDFRAGRFGEIPRQTRLR
jgi:redox-sensitive bicupin YhaK (pirin superfamily)